MLLLSLISSLIFGIEEAKALSPEALLAKITVEAKTLPLPGKNQYLNPFSKVGMSYSNLELGKDEHELALSVSPKSLAEGKRYKQLSEAMRTDLELSQKVLRSQSLLTAYSALVSAALAKDQASSAQELKALLEKSQKLSALEARRSRTEVKNVLKASADLHKSLNEMIDTEAQNAGVRDFLSAQGLRLEDLDTSDLIEPQEIAARLENMSAAGSALSSRKIHSDLEVSRFNAMHSTAQRSKFLNDIEFSARQDRRNNYSFRMEVSFNLPFLAAQDLNDYRDSLRVVEAEVGAQKALLEESRRSAGLAQVLRQKIALYSAMGSSPEVSNAALLSQDPALALELQRTSVALRLTKASLLAEIRTLYINLLAETEVLASQPGINHLSRTGRKI